MKPLFSGKGGSRDNIILVEDDKIVSDDTHVAQTFNKFFDNTVKNLGITENQLLLTEVVHSKGKVNDAIKMYEAHPSIIKIKEHVNPELQFSFSLTSVDDIQFEIKNLKPKAIPHMDIPIAKLKEMVYVVSEPLKEI